MALGTLIGQGRHVDCSHDGTWFHRVCVMQRIALITKASFSLSYKHLSCSPPFLKAWARYRTGYPRPRSRDRSRYVDEVARVKRSGIDKYEVALCQRFPVHLGTVSHQSGRYSFSQASCDFKESSEVLEHDELHMRRCLPRIDACDWHPYRYPVPLEA